MLVSSSRREWKAIVVPSGDQAGEASSAKAELNRTRFMPWAVIVYTPDLPSDMDVKMIRVPPGDHAGATSSVGLSVNRI